MNINKNINKNKKTDRSYWDESVHTPISYLTIIIATGIQFVLGIRNINTPFGFFCMLEFAFGLSGILLLDRIHGKKRLYPKPFKKITSGLFFRFAITFGVIAVIQFIFQIVPLITSLELVLATVFCPPCEEYFFRGILMEPAFQLGKKTKPENKFIIWRYSPKKGKPPKVISIYEICSIIGSGVFFAVFHVNYYGQTNLMLMVLVGGWWLSLVYFWNKDLTALILAHFLLNIIFVYQFWKVIF